MNFINIHEVLFNPFYNENLTYQLFSKPEFDNFKEEHKSELNPYCYALYRNDNSKSLLVGWLGQDENEIRYGDKMTLENYINGQPIKNFNHLTYLVNLYIISDSWLTGEPPEVNPQFTSINIIDSLFEESNGQIIYPHQLENLYLLFSDNRDDAINFRKNILKKRADTFKIASEMEIDNSNLENIINERMVFGFTIRKRLSVVKKLYELIN